MNLNFATNISNYVPDSGLNLIVDSILMALTYIVLLNTMIPISLIVSIEIVKMSQSYFINKDKLMFS
jgi:phospholipid-translocating ATPase